MQRLAVDMTDTYEKPAQYSVASALYCKHHAIDIKNHQPFHVYQSFGTEPV